MLHYSNLLNGNTKKNGDWYGLIILTNLERMLKMEDA